jgi:hypothetical protein
MYKYALARCLRVFLERRSVKLRVFCKGVSLCYMFFGSSADVELTSMMLCGALWVVYIFTFYFVLIVLVKRPPLWSSCHSSWLQNGDVLCFL